MGGSLLSRQVVGVRLQAQRKDPGLLIRESWVRIPPGSPTTFRSCYLRAVLGEAVDEPPEHLAGVGRRFGDSDSSSPCR
jgi:hypothetical protein